MLYILSSKTCISIFSMLETLQIFCLNKLWGLTIYIPLKTLWKEFRANEEWRIQAPKIIKYVPIATEHKFSRIRRFSCSDGTSKGEGAEMVPSCWLWDKTGLY